MNSLKVSTGYEAYLDECPKYIPPELVGASGGKSNKTYQCYLIELQTDFQYDINIQDILLVTHAKLDNDFENLSLDLDVRSGKLTMRVRHIEKIQLSSQQVVLCQRFQITLFRVLLDHNLNKLCEELDHHSKRKGSMTFNYLLLPSLGSHPNISIDWKCVTAGLYLENLSLDGHKSCLSPNHGGNYVHAKNGLLCRCVVENSLVCTPHNGHLYCIVGTLEGFDGTTCFKLKDGESVTYEMYYKQKYGIRLKYQLETLLKAKLVFTIQNYLHRSKTPSSKEPTSTTCELPPELYSVVMSPISISIFYSFSFLPSVMHRIESLLLASNLRTLHAKHWKQTANIPILKVLEAITTKRCQEKFNLESLETLGDSFLKYAASRQLFCTYQNQHEGILSIRRSKVISNESLCKLGSAQEITGFIRNEPFDPSTWTVPGSTSSVPIWKKQTRSSKTIYVGGSREIKSKTVADVVEALIGAYLSTGDETVALSFMAWLGIGVSFINVPYTRNFVMNPELHINVKFLESLLNYSFRDASLLVEALTHGSYMLPDIPRCYQVRWTFLDAVLIGKGFDYETVQLFRNCIRGQAFSVQMNGVALGYFKPKQGLRQGDPLSPFLFILVQDTLSRLLLQGYNNGRIGRYYHPTGAPLISHLMYADDLLIFSRGDITSVRNINKIIEKYCGWSGQEINKEKSAIFCSKHIGAVRKIHLLRMTGFKSGIMPMTYLGAPLSTGRITRQMLQPTMDKIRRKLSGWKGKVLTQGGRLVLIKHVMGAMPMHIMSVIELPQYAIKEIRRMMANFFWGEHEGKHKMHWKKWQGLCKPIIEGGLGVRDLADIQKAMGMKICYKLMTEDNLWARFLRAKYQRHEHVWQRLNKPTDSPFWRFAMARKEEVMDHIKILVKKGNSDFWFDKWLSSGPLAARVQNAGRIGVAVAHYATEGAWNQQALSQAMGNDIAAEIMLEKAPVEGAGHDKIIWSPAADGVFSLKSAWEVSREQAATLEESYMIWNKALPVKMALCAWKALQRCLPTDDLIKTKGIAMVSVCHCCQKRQQETLDHLLSDGDLATDVWNRAAQLMGIPFARPASWRIRLSQWKTIASQAGLNGFIASIIPTVVTWCLWTMRCKARFEEKQPSAVQAWREVKNLVVASVTMAKLGFKRRIQEEPLLSQLNINLPWKKKDGIKIVQWVKPPLGWVKLNTDGSSNGNPGPSGAGGIIRNHEGHYLAAYSKFLGSGTNNLAELRAATEGLRLCKSKGWRDVILETDSMVLVGWILKNQCSLWYLWDFWEEFQSCREGMRIQVLHQFREVNGTADYLAKQGSSGNTVDCWTYSQLPQRIRGSLRLDRTGLPNIRMG